jgi:hypothetical protein
MFGRAPITFPSQPYAFPVRPPSPPPISVPPPANPQWASANPKQQPAPRPIIRAQAEDPPPSRLSLRLPSPEELGIPVAKVEVAQKSFEQRLQQLGATALKVESLTKGGFLARIVLPGDRPVEAHGTSHAAAMNLALDRAELSLRP